MNDTTQDSVITEEAEIIEVSPDEGQAQVLLSLENLIKVNITSIDKLQSELKQQKDMLEDVFINDPTYQEHAKQAKQAADVKKGTRSEIMKRPAVLTISNKVKSMQADLKEKQNALSDYLKEYSRMAGVNEIESEEGEILEIVATMRVVRKASKSR